MGGGDEFFGYCKSVDGKLISLDGDNYSEGDAVVRYEEWSDPDNDIRNGLTVVVEGVWNVEGKE